MSEHAQDIWAALTVSYFSFSWPLGAVVCVRLRFSESSGLLVFKVEKCKTGSDFLHMNNHRTSPNTNVCVRAVENNDLPCKWKCSRLIYRQNNNRLFEKTILTQGPRNALSQTFQPYNTSSSSEAGVCSVVINESVDASSASVVISSVDLIVAWLCPKVTKDSRHCDEPGNSSAHNLT